MSLVRASNRFLVPLVLLLLGALAGDASAQGHVWVVDGSGGADFTEIQPAVDAAAEGDVIYVRRVTPTPYASFQVVAKTLTLAAEPLPISGPLAGVPTLLEGTIEIRDLAPDQSLVLIGFDVRSPAPVGGQGQATLEISDCRGGVVIQNSIFTRKPGPGGTVSLPPLAPAVRLIRAQAVLFVASLAQGQEAVEIGSSSPGLWVAASRAFLFDSTAEGGKGSSAYFAPSSVVPATPGGDGLFLGEAALYSAGSRFIGGDGGRGIVDAAMNCFPSQDGGDGLVLLGSGSKGTLVDSSMAGGIGGVAPPGTPCAAGTDGKDLDAVKAQIRLFTGRQRRLIVDALVREGHDLLLRFEGVPGEEVLLAQGTLDTQASTELAAPFLLKTVTSRRMGTIPASGILERRIPIGDLGAGVEAVPLLLQAVFVAFPTGGGVTPSNPAAVLLLDDSF